MSYNIDRTITPNPPADFTPSMGNYKTLQPFRYWCQKVLPLVYDDSLSYYELLCKVVDYLNKTMEDVETLHGDVTNLHTAYVKLQSYVNNYFSTLDVQEEINNKLDNMASNGELYEIIRRYTDPIVNEQNEKINVLKSRMDTFASLPNGSTSGDAELTDIRVGYNGNVYPSAGDAVREQVGGIKDDLVTESKTNYDVYDYNDNRLFLDNLEKNKYIAINGKIIESNGWSLSDYLPVEKNETYVWTYDLQMDGSVPNIHYGLFDVNKNWIGSGTMGSGNLDDKKLIVTDENTFYVRISQADRFFNNESMVIKKSIFDHPTHKFIEFRRYLKKSPVREMEEKTEQIGGIKDDLVTESETNYDVYDYNENRLFLDNLEKNKYITINGKIIEYAGWSLSDYLPVEKNETYVWTYDLKMDGSVPNIHYGLFDVNKNWIGSGTMGSGNLDDKKLIVTDENTFYVRISEEDRFFNNESMVIKKSIFDHPTHKFIEFRRYLKKSPVREIEEKIECIEPYSQPNYDSVMRSIQRIGAGMEHPIHSVEAFIDAYKKGFRILLCDLIFTSDNVPVCNHDFYLNQHYKNVYDSNGNLVSTENPIYFKNNTYETLSQYSYGKIGYPLLKFVDMLKLVRKLGTELYVEVKEMTEEQCKIACNLIKQYGLVEKTSWVGMSSQMKMVIANIETARVSIMPETITDEIIGVANTLKTGKNKVFIFGWDTTTLTNDIVKKLIQNDMEFEQGTLNTNKDIVDYMNRGDAYYYCTGIESDKVVAGKALLEDRLSN